MCEGVGASWIALRLHSSGLILPRPECVILLRLQSLFTSLLFACYGSTALKACVLVRFPDSACRKHVLAPVPRVLGFRPGQPTFKGIRQCALLRATHPHRTSPYFWRKLDCVDVVLIWRDPPTSRVCDPSEARVSLHLPA